LQSLGVYTLLSREAHPLENSPLCDARQHGLYIDFERDAGFQHPNVVRKTFYPNFMLKHMTLEDFFATSIMAELKDSDGDRMELKAIETAIDFGLRARWEADNREKKSDE